MDVSSDKSNLPPYAPLPESLGRDARNINGSSDEKTSLIRCTAWEQPDLELGVTAAEERSRSEGLATMFNTSHYSHDTYHSIFFTAMVLAIRNSCISPNDFHRTSTM